MDRSPHQKELADTKGTQPTLIIYCEIYFNSQFVQHVWKNYLMIFKQVCINIVKKIHNSLVFLYTESKAIALHLYLKAESFLRRWNSYNTFHKGQ